MGKLIAVLCFIIAQQTWSTALASTSSTSKNKDNSQTISANTPVDAAESATEETERKNVSSPATPERRIVDTINSHSAGLGLGETFLLGDFEKHGRDKITVDLFYSYSASYSFDFLADLHYSKHSYKQEEVILPGLALDIKGKVYQFDAFSPYLLGGVGFYRPQIVRNGERTEGQIVFGYNFGGGVDLRLNQRVTVGLLVQYHNPFDVKPDNGDRVEGSYAKMMFTAMYTF